MICKQCFASKSHTVGCGQETRKRINVSRWTTVVVFVTAQSDRVDIKSAPSHSFDLNNIRHRTINNVHLATPAQRHTGKARPTAIHQQSQIGNMTNIEKGDIVLVTGVSGYIGSHVAEQLIVAGYKVRGTSRTSLKAQWLVDYLDKKFGSGKIDIVEVPDMVQDGAYDAAVVGVSGIVHLASVLTFSTDPEEVVGPSVRGTLNLFKSATTEPKVKSLVFTSSSTACLLPVPNTKIKITKDTFNDIAVEAAYRPNASPFDVYAASKTASERALWDAVKNTSPPFQVSAVLPDANFGSLLKQNDSSTGSWIVDFYNGQDYLFDLPPQWFVDVTDNAKLHVAALIDPACDGQRIFAFAQPYNWNDILAIFRMLKPNGSFLEDRAQGRNLSEVPNSDAEKLLEKHYSHGWTSLEDSIRQNIGPLLA
jgi:nucleoside-diphosphate-sugar epimerase